MFIQAEKTFITFHYFRFDGDYAPWDLWVWPNEKEGRAFSFQGFDDFGAKAELEIANMAGSSKIGFIIRRVGDQDEWAEREYGDRYIEELGQDGSVHVWLIQGDDQIYEQREDAFLRRRKRIVEAEMISRNQIHAVLNAPISGEYEHVLSTLSLTCGHGFDEHEVPLRSMQLKDARNLYIQTEQPLSLQEHYRLSIHDYGFTMVGLSGMYSHPLFEDHFAYRGNDLGLTYDRTSTTFRVWAPGADETRLVLYSTWESSEGAEMEMSPAEQGTWTIRVDGDLNGVYYRYKVRRGDRWAEAVDPYAKALSVNGWKGAVIPLCDTDPEGWSEDTRPPLQELTDSIIYELHIRDATIHPSSGSEIPGTYLGLIERGTKGAGGRFPTGFDYFTALGVTHIQLLPVSDFISVDEADTLRRLYNWGYDPAFYFAPEGSYASDPYDPKVRIYELKRVVQAFHSKGIRIVLDVVFNHLFSALRSSLGKLVPKYYFRYREDGQLADGTGVGNDTASERFMMRKLIVDCVEYWAKEYHVDGFRFDLMGIHDVETMNEIRERLDAIDPSILLYGEGWVMDTPLDNERKANQPNAAKLPGIGQFYDRMRDGLKGSVFNLGDRGFVNGDGSRAFDVMSGIVGGISYAPGIAGFSQEPVQTINYAEVHDNHTMWDRLLLSNSDDSDSIRMRMHRLASSIVLTSQGIPFLHAGQEWFRTKNGEHNSYRSPDTVNRIDWNRAYSFRENIDFLKGLILLRRSHSAFRLGSAEEIRRRLTFLTTDIDAGLIVFSLSGRREGDLPYETLVVACNASQRLQLVTLPFPSCWTLLCDGQTAGIKPISAFDHVKTEAVVCELSISIWGC